MLERSAVSAPGGAATFHFGEGQDFAGGLGARLVDGKEAEVRGGKRRLVDLEFVKLAEEATLRACGGVRAADEHGAIARGQRGVHRANLLAIEVKRHLVS